SGATWGTPVRSYYGSGTDAFAAKLSSSGSLTWNTFLGGSGTDSGESIAVDGGGNVYVAGYSNATWGTPVGSYGSGYDAFAAKLSGSGSLTWNTFHGGSGDDFGKTIAMDGSGNVYVVGISTATWGSPVRSYYGSGQDAFAAKLNSSGSLTWNTFLGGSGTDSGLATVDGSGNVYIAGQSNATWGTPVGSYTSGYDAFAAKLSPYAHADPAGVCASNLPCYNHPYLDP
ncbi:MAG: SBBP repeat-containing protein, partial [Chloroflexi bacterium]|nr:SBBP repeat-containing protein [Chloroflexota bacterium]